MKTKLAILAAALIFFSLSCSKVPITNRRQFNMIPEVEMESMSYTAYSDFLKTHTVIAETDSSSILVKKVGKKISDAIVTYLKAHGQSKRVNGYQWEFKLVADPEVNAWCMPGGKVVVYSALLPVTQDENGLAVVLGHEIAHAIARHGNERMSQQIAIQMGGMAVSVALATKPAETQQIFNQVYGTGTGLGALAYSRKHESEADKLGLCFMAMAGYDPQTAVPFWERMAQQNPNQPLQWLSTHPNDATRIADIKKFMPTALKYYKK
ncbi:MAG TPA: M48 family metallopeptidase [Bacteroidia bacterium]|jgi:predicted Zn-dependent protease|nr:M48 family metallopeptidase [Bacteroidia bacterium]